MYNGLKVLSSYHRKGGVGKTFLASTIAYLLASGGPDGTGPKKRVLILDVDSQQDTSGKFLQMTKIPGEDSYSAPYLPNEDWEDNPNLTGINYTTDILFGIEVLEYETPIPNICIIPSEGNIDRIHKLNGESDTIAEGISTLMSEWFTKTNLHEDYDIVIIDNPPSKTPMAAGMLEAATHLIMPVELDRDSVDGAENLVTRVNNINRARGKGATPLEIVGIVPNNIPLKLAKKDEAAFEQLLDPSSNTSRYVSDFDIRNRQCYRPERKPTTSEVDFKYVSEFRAKKEMYCLYNLVLKKIFNESVKSPFDILNKEVENV